MRISKTGPDTVSNRNGAVAPMPSVRRHEIDSRGSPLLDVVVVLGVAALFAALFLSIRAVEKL